ncbi:20196_t:CDS:2 [Funneliformis geosporum]|nr:20196_t:CDS:2 [Funneliformis geosporum]
MEYADGGALKSYLKENFLHLEWDDKYKLAYQLACAVSCLHNEGIVHRDLHSGNILIRQGVIKLADFGLSKRIEAATNQQSKLFGIIPYIDPKRFARRNRRDSTSQQYMLTDKSDVYSVGVLFWEISSGCPPFYVEGEQYDIDLAVDISQGLREKVVPGTPEEYVNIYTECWQNEPDNRPTMSQVVDQLSSIITKSKMTVNEQMNFDDKIDDKTSPQLSVQHHYSNNVYASTSIDNSLHGELSQLSNSDNVSSRGDKVETYAIVDVGEILDAFKVQIFLNGLNKELATLVTIQNPNTLDAIIT